MGFWPFKKKEKVEIVDPSTLSYTQVDITREFDQNLSLTNEDWVDTMPINEFLGNDNNGNIPALGAIDHEIYRVALSLSEIREEFHVPGDGVYCPICHLANTDITKLGEACPKCERPLLAFGWN
ncbi:MAG: hypothetical protein ABL959_08095 [Pyrinomonadaceae bacterium]